MAADTTYKIQFRRGTAVEWTTANPILGSGEPGFETDTGLIKLGDGTQVWTLLPYTNGSLASINSPVFTGNPQAPTPPVDDNDTSIATSAFVIGQASSSLPIGDGAATIGTSKRYARADHKHPSDSSHVRLTGDTMTGDLTIATGGTGRVVFDSPSGTYGGPQFRTAGSYRWWLYKNNAPESGANSGSDLMISRYDDAGTSLGVALSISRATGKTSITNLDSPTALVPLYNANWENYVADLKVTSVGNLVVLQGFIRYNTAGSVTLGQQANIGTVPSGFRPLLEAAQGSGLVTLTANNGSFEACRFEVATTGIVSFWHPLAGSYVSGGMWVIANMSYTKG